MKTDAHRWQGGIRIRRLLTASVNLHLWRFSVLPLLCGSAPLRFISEPCIGDELAAREPTDAALKSDIEAAKAFGFNLLRKHAKVEPERWYY
jgi:hypothetical protein